MNLSISAVFAASLMLGISGHPPTPAFISDDAKAALTTWFAAHPGYHLLADSDCRCDDDLKATRTQSRGAWKALPDYHPYYVVGDFNGDAKVDLAVCIASRHQREIIRILIIDNFRAHSNQAQTAFLSNTFSRGTVMFFGAPRPKPYRLVAGPFESEGIIFEPTSQGRYRLKND